MKKISFPVDTDTEIIAKSVSDLMHESAGDDRFRLFCAIALHTEDAFLGGGYQRMLKEGHLSDEAKAELLANPAAPVLLAYFVNSLIDFNATSGNFYNCTADLFGEATLEDFKGEESASASAKREALAKSFRLVGKKGEQHATVGERSREEMAFNRARDAALAEEQAKPRVTTAEAERLARLVAFKHMFLEAHGVAFIYDDDTHKSRMKALRERLAHL